MDEAPIETTTYSLGEDPPAPSAAASERRDGERHLTLFRVGSLIIDGCRELCLIRNISAGGMMIRAYCMVAIGARVVIELKCGEPVSGTAKWVQGETVGVEFDEPVDVVELLAASMDGPRPRMPRIEVGTIAWLRLDGDVFTVRAVDISQGGVKISVDRDLPVGSDVTITLPGLSPHGGVIRWSDGAFYGVTFNHVVALPQLVAWLNERRNQLRAAS